MKIEAIDKIIATDYQLILKEEGETTEHYKSTIKKCQSRIWNEIEHLENCLAFMVQDLKHVFTEEQQEAKKEIDRLGNEVRELNAFWYSKDLQTTLTLINN